VGVYATIANLQARLPGRTIGTSSKPTQSQCEAWIDEAEAFLAGSLAASGCTSTVTAGKPGVKLMASWTLDYAEGHTRIAFASGEGEGRNQDGKDLVEKFDKLLSDIAREPNRFEIMLQGGGSGGVMVRGYVRDNNDDKNISDGDFDPYFDDLTFASRRY